MKQHQLLAVVGLPPLPGAIDYDGTPVADIARSAKTEAATLIEAGVQGLILQNIGDAPVPDHAGAGTLTAMSVIAAEIRGVIGNAQFGISVLRNDGAGAVAIAKASGADFIRAKIYVGALVGAGGIEVSCMNEVLAARRELDADVAVWADIRSRTGVPLAPMPFAQECALAVSKGRSEALIVSGATLDEALDYAREAKKLYPGKTIVLGGGATPDRLREIVEVCDATVVGTYIKQGGDIAAPLDPDRLDIFIRAYRNACES